MAVLTDNTGTLIVVKTLFQAFRELKPILKEKHLVFAVTWHDGTKLSCMCLSMTTVFWSIGLVTSEYVNITFKYRSLVWRQPGALDVTHLDVVKLRRWLGNHRDEDDSDPVRKVGALYHMITAHYITFVPPALWHCSSGCEDTEQECSHMCNNWKCIAKFPSSLTCIAVSNNSLQHNNNWQPFD